MRLLRTAIVLAVLFCIPFAIWGDRFMSWFTGDAAIAWIRSWGPWGWLAIIGLLVGDLFLPVPATPVMSAAGYLYGPWIGGILSATGSFCAGMAGYGLCRAFGHRIAARLAGEEELTQHHTLFQRSGPWLVAASRWLPLLPEVVSCLAGLTRMPLRTFALSLACGAVPMGFVYAGIGAAGQEHPALALAGSVAVPPLLWMAVRPLLRRHTALTILVLALSLTAARAAEPRDLQAVLESVRTKYHLPACAAAVVERGEITAIGATGLRVAGRDVPATTADVWHIGSCTKSMTATLAGAMVDTGKLRWDESVAEALPHLACDPAWREITVWDVVTHRAGLGNVRPPEELRAQSTLSLGEQRAALARWLLARAPTESRTKSIYSNAGYGLLGAILEHASGETYEQMLGRHIFTPLALKSAGLGPAATLGQVDQPWGHRRRGETLVPVEPTPASQFPPMLAPAGCVHLSLRDFARYAWWFSSNHPQLLTPATFARLHTPPEGFNYAGGVWKTELPAVGGEALCHSGHMGGSFGIFYAGRGLACVAVFNMEGGGWEWLGDVLVEAVLRNASPPSSR